MRFIILISLSAILAACSTASSIMKASESKSAFDDAVYKGKEEIIDTSISDENAYRIFHQASTGFVSIQSIRNSAEKRAEDFCKRENKVMHSLRERTSSPPYILGNFPRIEIVFACIESNNEKSFSTKNDKYEKIKQLKALLDDGAITNDEYQAEKTKLLSEQ